MEQKDSGFSLMESLLVLLVLSVSMLGLGRLQARLWESSGDLYARNNAHLIATNISTAHQIDSFFPSAVANELAIQRLDTTPHFHLEHSVYSAGSTTASEVILSWERPSGENSISLNSTFYSAPTGTDAIWLFIPK